ncbi:MAG: hypothetical protein ACK5NT_00470 [Pyrinomonadaceae bacterium]
MKNGQPTEAELRRYLLNMLDNDELTKQIDKMLFADESLMNSLEIVESELIEDYLSKTLDPSFKPQFEEVYLNCGTKYESFRFHQALFYLANSCENDTNKKSKTTKFVE